MKTTRKMGKRLLSLLLCCVMLGCTAFAAAPNEIRVGDLIISTNPDAGINPLFLGPSHKLFDASSSSTSSRPFVYLVNTDPDLGSRMEIKVENTGDTVINVELTITASSGSPLTLDQNLNPGAAFDRVVSQKDGLGLDCSISLTVKPVKTGVIGNFYVSIYQGEY